MLRFEHIRHLSTIHVLERSKLSCKLEKYAENAVGKVPVLIGSFTRHFTSKSFTNVSKRNISKVLVANRGEIAIRIMRAAKQLGLRTVAVFSTADRNAVHTRFADQAVCIGPPPSTQSYLNIHSILKAAKETGADAVHPGYGFLSEHVDFAEALEKEGIKFVGPNTKAIRAMGDKIESKRIAKKAGVYIIDGYIGEINSDRQASEVAKEIGFPVMVKASAGGGGKGMRVASNEKELIEAFRICKSEAESAFGDSRLLIEKYIVKPRHIEIQILADEHGNVVYFPERECSVQRRNQKVIEEAPSPLLDPITRQKMGEQAVALAKEVGYTSAGTVEYLVSGLDKSFHFLEMNTRLQVEHPITEAITGIDLAQSMFRIAAGERLHIKQEDISIVGSAIECRIYAENPYNNFLPSVGNIRCYKEPKLEHLKPLSPSLGNRLERLEHLNFNSHGVRVDAGVEEGLDIPIFYDPLISKLVTFGEDRTVALHRMANALDEYVIDGDRLVHNVPFCRAVISNPKFISGDITTNLIKEEWPDGFHGVSLSKDQSYQAMSATAMLYFRDTGYTSTIVKVDNHQEQQFLVRRVNNNTLGFQPIPLDWNGAVPKNATEELVSNSYFKTSILGGGRIELINIETNNNLGVIQVKRLGNSRLDLVASYTVTCFGAKFDVCLRPAYVAVLEKFMKRTDAASQSKILKAPMPGTVRSINVKEKDSVSEGQEVAVLEAMKMQNVLRAPSSGIVKRVFCSQGEILSLDQPLVEIE
ncbi:propionyl-CoA carboxylase alpha chain [Galdieria sulphuraria]|uniref:Propionyl-CoA carboxylase alpha chain n=1 Tax=Galdieria sulphuraria TaxID=130081 RepID=M2XG64_GALSU|nr:propionyl-CoA carboxylase alpha chain [Galdieria sulphuraria]EME29032.1 propionyl-CoA carboxylase alpha chain [Galdieria sulphuraria]|eukprot:XP_005705552.1 propionyl-CoA carboxylase alpha chain [Galdieria sulphuraria]